MAHSAPVPVRVYPIREPGENAPKGFEWTGFTVVRPVPLWYSRHKESVEAVNAMIIGYMKLALAALGMAFATALLYALEKKTSFGRWNPALRQGIIGVVFGGLAVLATEYGIPIGGATLNVRDAAPLCAGLIFGAPAGIIAGVIGGVERWFAVLWGAGAYTRLACSLSTVLAGLFAGALRKHMFDDKKPTWFFGLTIGLVMEVLHMLMIFVTNMDDVRGAFTYVEQCAGPMIGFTGLAVMLAVLVVTLFGREPVTLHKDMKKITQAFQRWLLVCVSIAFLVTCVLIFSLETTLSRNNAKRLLTLNLADVEQDIQDMSDENMLRITEQIVAKVESTNPGVWQTFLRRLASEYSIAEINIIDADGVISRSTNPAFIGYDMAGGEQSAAFLCLLKERTELVQAYQPISYDASISRKYAGVALKNGGFLQVGYDAESFQRDIKETVTGLTRNRHVGEEGAVIICDENWRIVSDRRGNTGENLSVAGIWVDTSQTPQNTAFREEVYGEPALNMYDMVEGYVILATIPESETLFARDMSTYVMAFMEIILFAALFIMIYFLIKRQVVDNIRRINGSLAKITNGDLNERVNVRSHEEFASLSDDINSTVVTLKRYIAEAEARIDKELEFAREIQHSALPSVFPPFPNRKEFDLFAVMRTAKEVGGDFYDFYLLDETHLAFLIADVSGKGIPAALFMMKSKTLLKSLAETGADIAEVLTRANAELCEGNDAGMFVTAWMGVLDTARGLVRFANAGHNPPLVLHRGEESMYLKTRPGFVLAGMEGIRYRLNELQLHPGDVLYLYTDGVTEATDRQERLYGEERLKAVCDGHPDASTEELTSLIQADIDRFVGDAPQFDDITMLALRYLG